jgi:putative transport protein
VGTRSGHAFLSTLREGEGIPILLTGAVVTFAAASLTLWAGYKLLKIPAGLLIGVLSGLQTQPALLGFSCDRTRDDLPNVGYAIVYPLIIIAKIILAQVIAALLM